MKQSLKDIETEFYCVLKSKISINEFEEWLYNSPEIEDYYGTDLYMNLLNINYKYKYVIMELENSIYDKIPYGYFENLRIKDILSRIIERKGDLVKILEELYDNYCDGYKFLRYLGLSFILNGIDRNGLPDNVKVKIEEKLINEAERILGFLDNGEIKITGEFEYEDLRKVEDKIEITDLEKMFK